MHFSHYNKPEQTTEMENEDLLSVVFSWSIDDIFNDDLYRNQVKIVPQTFPSVQDYVESFISPLLEELRAEVSSAMDNISRAPFAEVIYVKKQKAHETTCNVGFDHWRRTSNNYDKEPYAPLHGDILVFTQAKPETAEDLQRLGRSWAFGCVTKRSGESEPGIAATHCEIKVSNDFKVGDGMYKFLCAGFLINTSSYMRIWSALLGLKTSKVIEKILSTDSEVKESCDMCQSSQSLIANANHQLMSKLNDSQYKAVATCLSKLECTHRPGVELIWGPPGTGKTRTLAVLLVALSKLKYSTLTCAPTNVAIAEVASRLVAVVRESRRNAVGKNDFFLPMGDILLFGNKNRLKVNPDIELVNLDYRVKKLVECFGSGSAGWRSCCSRMIQFLEGFSSSSEYFSDNQQCDSLKFVREFNQLALMLKECISTICTHLPIRSIGEHTLQRMIHLVELLNSFEVSKELNHLSLKSEGSGSSRKEWLCALSALQISLNQIKIPSDMKECSIRDFCFQMASLVLCTASNSYKFHKESVKPFRVLIIEEAAQLKECESVIPLQVCGISHVVLLGDERQLPALVHSKVCQEAMFGRSLFERLSLLGYGKHLLNVQYRMHPLLSSFPNAKFYDNRIMDAPEVKSKSYRKIYLPGPMFGPLSFINIPAGKEVRNEQGSWKNMVEVAVVSKIVQLLHRACISSKCKVTVGVVAPYSAQIAELERKIVRKYENHDDFSLKIYSIDGCQGGEVDVIIMSTVRCTTTRSIDFICSPQRINVSLTRARHCLWILGDERTLTRKNNIWNEIISDAKARMCFFHADENKDIETAIWNVKKELDQLDDFLDGHSMLFNSSRWKVMFSDNFKKSFVKLKSVEMKNLVLYLLYKLSSGWRPKRSFAEILCERSSQILKHYMVKDMCIVCSIDVEMVEDIWSQVLKIWDVLPFGELLKLVQRLDGIFEMYTDDYIKLCKLTDISGDFEVPVTWGPSFKVTRYKSLSNSVPETTDEYITCQNVLFDDSLLLMKFYSLSSGTVNHLLSGCDGKEVSLPFELTNHQREIVLFNKSAFILSRSGTGKTTVLTMKLVRNEQLCHIASEGFHIIEKTLSKTVVDEDESGTKRAALRQLFVTVSPKLCFAVKQELEKLKSLLYGGTSSVDETNSTRGDEISELTQFADIPDSFVDLSPDSYPLVITFRKFLMMLNGTIGSTYFGRFSEARHLCHRKTGNLRSVALQSFIQRKEVNYEKFVSSYWPHFNTNNTKKLDVSLVFTEIMSVIKGGLKAREAHNGVLSLTEYVRLQELRGSNLSEQKRQTIYDIFLQYEKLKLVYGEFDLADLVIDLHRRFKDEKYKGQLMDFVYIDEVQDLSMGQIALFQYICRNVDGFVFSGDTAQTIAHGISFRFEDIRRLFYEQFVLRSRCNEIDGKDTKGLVSEIFNLRENFRTHAGVLKLAQSVIELVYHFFPYSIDKLGPETSPLNGETPVLLRSSDNINAIKVIFGKSDKDEKIEGFGAEQVILVRNDHERKDIVEYVGNRALVLTYMECKGLEFQDVLLYNFFSTSPMEDRWAVIYRYIKDNNLFELPGYFPTFSEEKHNLMCSELKQLYVAVTRTKHRLWICENAGFGDPMYLYWKSLGVVQERHLDSSFLKEIQAVSSREDWKASGLKLLQENNFERATLCFERAGDMYWSKYTKAAQLRTSSTYMHGPDTATSHDVLRQAAEIFESIGNAEQAAQCFFEAHDYERAGKIYLANCGESKLECAGDCFLRARCYKAAADVYYKANLFSKCLSSCINGNFFDMGVLFIERWKREAASEKLVEIRNIEHDFLQKVALHFHDLKDIFSMLKYVRLFSSIDQIHSFLKRLTYIDEFHILEEERKGNIIGAANIAKRKGYYSIEIDLFEKAGLFTETSMLILWYIFTDTVLDQAKDNKLCLQYVQKNELLNKAKSIAINISDQFYEFVCSESDILSKFKNHRKLFDSELQFIHCWKLKAPKQIKRDFEIEKSEQDVVGRCARHYYRLRDYPAMWNHVEAYYSPLLWTDMVRSSLRTLRCFDALLWFEKNWGNLDEAAEILSQNGRGEEAFELIIKYVCCRSLWASLNKGWPLKNFPDKAKFLTKAISFLKNHSSYDYVCVEANILDSSETNLSVLNEHFIASQKKGSLLGEIISTWKILDAHLHSFPQQFKKDECITNLTNHAGFMISQNQLSEGTLIYFWNFWKQKIVLILDYLNEVGPKMGSRHSIFEEFCSTYMGVYKLEERQCTIYVVLDCDAKWVGLSGCKFLRRNGKIGYISVCDFQSAALMHWSRVLFSVGIDVLKTLKALNACSVKTFSSLLPEVMSVVNIFEVAKFLKQHYFHHQVDNKFVNECLNLAIQSFIANVFPIECPKALTKSLIILREGKEATSFVHEAILENVHRRSKLTYGEIGRILLMMLSSYGLPSELFLRIATCFEDYSTWYLFIKEFSGCKLSSNVVLVSATGCIYAKDLIVVHKFFEALRETYNTDWKSEKDYMSPSCFLYFLERLLFMASYFNGYMFSTRASLVEWLIFKGWATNSNANLVNHMNLSKDLEQIVYFMADVVRELLLNERDTKEWIRSSESNVEDHFRYLVLRLMVHLCLLCLNYGRHFHVLFGLLNKREIRLQLPRAFCDAIFKEDCYFVDALADALGKIGNPLVIVGVGDNFMKFSCCDAIFVNLRVEKSKEDLMGKLFHDEHSMSNLLGGGEDNRTKCPCYSLFWEGFDPLKLEHQEAGNDFNFISVASKLKVEGMKSYELVSAAMDFFPVNEFDDNGKLLAEVNNMLNDLMELQSLLDVREEELKSNTAAISLILKRLQLGRPRLEPFLNGLLLKFASSPCLRRGR